MEQGVVMVHLAPKVSEKENSKVRRGMAISQGAVGNSLPPIHSEDSPQEGWLSTINGLHQGPTSPGRSQKEFYRDSICKVLST